MSNTKKHDSEASSVALRAYPGDFTSGADLFQALDSYFRFYNHRRPHQGLSYRMPADLFPHRTIRKRSSP